MKLIITAKNPGGVKDYIKDEIEKRFDKLEKYFTDDATAYVTLSWTKKNVNKVEITVNMRNSVLRSEIEDKDSLTAFDKAADKIERQLGKYKERLRNRNYDSIRYENISSDIAEENVPNIVKNKKFALTAMKPAEACFRLELLEHQFYVFLNEETNAICVVYKRNDGDYGLIETE